MRTLVLFLLSFGWTAMAAPKLGLGVGLETRLDRQVNPGYDDFRHQAQLFQQFQWFPYVLSLEFAYDQKQSSSGAFAVKTTTYAGGAWGRYVFYDPDRWSPYLAAGVGTNVDYVDTSLAKESDRRRGTRLFSGLGLGVSRVVWKSLLLEAETRATMIDGRRDPALGLLIRAGVEL